MRSQVWCGRQNNNLLPSAVHIQTPGTCEYATSLGKRDFVGVIQVKDSEMGRLSWTIRCPNPITCLLKNRDPAPAIVSCGAGGGEGGGSGRMIRDGATGGEDGGRGMSKRRQAPV